jgi:hypothetical protein
MHVWGKFNHQHPVWAKTAKTRNTRRGGCVGRFLSWGAWSNQPQLLLLGHTAPVTAISNLNNSCCAQRLLLRFNKLS